MLNVLIFQLYLDRSGDADKAMELWTQLQEEGFIPSNEFLILLADILNRKGKLVPFNVPQRCEIKNKSKIINLLCTAIVFQSAILNINYFCRFV